MEGGILFLSHFCSAIGVFCLSISFFRGGGDTRSKAIFYSHEFPTLLPCFWAS